MDYNMKKYDFPDNTDRAFPFIAMRAVMQNLFPIHTHTYTEMIVVLGGEGIHVTAAGRCHLKRGTVMTVPPPLAHQIENMVNLDVFVLQFDLNRLISCDYDLKKDPGFRSLFIEYPSTLSIRESAEPLQLSDSQLEHVGSLITVMLDEYKGKKDGYQVIIRTHLLALTAYLSRCFLPEKNAHSLQMERILPTVTFMEENLDKSIRLRELAEMLYLSERQYSRIFSEVYGMTPSRYLSELRFNRACQMMTDPEIPIETIWSSCGFSDHPFFCRQFKKRYGLTPGQYRNRLIESIL